MKKSGIQSTLSALAILTAFLSCGQSDGEKAGSRDKPTIIRSHRMEIHHQVFGEVQSAEDSIPFANIESANPIKLVEQSVVIENSAGKPVSGMAYEVWQRPFMGYFLPGASLWRSSGVTDEKGTLTVQPHPQCFGYAVYLNPNNEPPVLLEHDGFGPGKPFAGSLRFWPKQPVSGIIQASASGKSRPKQMWIWQGTDLVSFPMLELLPEGVLINGSDLDYLLPAEEIENCRNDGDLRRGYSKPIEIAIGPNGESTFDCRYMFLSVCVLDNQGRFHFDSFDLRYEFDFKIRLLDQIEVPIKLIDNSGQPAVGAQIACSNGGGTKYHQIMNEFGKIPSDGKMKVTANADDFVTLAARWHQDDPWYTFDWMSHERDEDVPQAPLMLRQPTKVSGTVVGANGDGLNGGKVALVSQNFWMDPEHPSFYFETNLNSTGEFTIPRLPPINDVIVLVENDGWTLAWKDVEWSKDKTHVTIKLKKKMDIDVALEGDMFTQDFFPARVMLHANFEDIPILKWVNHGDPVRFSDVSCSETQIKVEGSNGFTAVGQWDGNSERLVIYENDPWE